MKTLLVDDIKSVRELMKLYLNEYGISNSVSNGEEAIEAVKTAIKVNEHYDFICLDIMMPVMNGLEALIEIRKMEANAGITKSKIIMTTGNYDAKSITNANSNGCDGYFLKPVSKEAIERKLKEFGLI